MNASLSVQNLRQQYSEADLRERLAQLSDDQLRGLHYDWDAWARPNQIRPPGDWSTWLILAGRGYGKTRVGAETVRAWKREGARRVNFIAPTSDDLRDVMVEGESGILAVCPREERPVYRVSKRRLEWPNGSMSLLFSAEEPDRLRGKQHDRLWCDEPASWQYDIEAWDQAMFGLRLGKDPLVVATTTPRPTKLIRTLIAEITTHVTRGTTYENRDNLAPGFYSKIIKKYEGTRLGRQELMAEVLDDNPGALFHLRDIEAGRVVKHPPLARIVVAIDPATTSNEDSDETGILAIGMDGRDPPHFYVLEDGSGIWTPQEWATKSIEMYHNWQADRIIGEANNGGDMIEAVIRAQDSDVAYKKVTASRGKAVRAEPVAALYEQHRVHHVGQFAALEDQMTNWDPKTDDDSPDRMDADVWGVTELGGGMDGFARFARGEAKAAIAVGHAPAPPTSRILIDGSNRDKCECGSTFWITLAGKQSCMKCAKARPA